MKLGVTYNVFDGEELLEASINSIRNSVDHINIIYQTTSNWGEKCSDNLEDMINDLMKKKLVDKIYKYQPKKTSAGKNELHKRNIGLTICKLSLCSHFLNMDCDEFYIKSQFDDAKKFIADNKIDASCCKFINYIKKPTWQIESYPPMYVPFIAKINLFSKINRKSYYPVLVDPTRKLNGSKKFKFFEADILRMEHMSLVRKDLAKKFSNSSSRNYHSTDYVTQAMNYEFPDQFCNCNVKEVKNIFNINF